MEDRIKKHFDEFYNRLVFLDSHLGEKEKTFEESFYKTIKEDFSGKIVSSLVFEENLIDEQIYIRHKGLKLTLVYGGPFNKKYKRIEIYIKKDPFYKGNEEGNVDELLSLMDEYISNHYKEFYEKINKAIYGSNNDVLLPVKYRLANILSLDNIKDITIEDANIKNKDITHLKKYPNLRAINIYNSKLNATNLGNIPFSYLHISNSELKSMYCLDHINTINVSIYNSRFASPTTRSIMINTENLTLDNIANISMADFFMCTNIRNAKKVTLRGNELTPIEVSLLPIFYKAVELEAYGEAESYDFFNELPELEYFQGFIKLVSDNVLDQVSRRFKNSLEKHNIKDREHINNYIFFQLVEALQKYKGFYESIRLSKLALLKYKGIIENSPIEYVRDILSLPLSKRQHLGEEHDINLIEPIPKDPFNLMLDNIDSRYLSKIVGRDGKQLILPGQIGYTNIFYILGPDGKILESVEKTEARDVTVPEHYEEVRYDIVENENNIFDYYYNRQFDEATKLSYLTNKINDKFYSSIEGFKEIIEKNRELIDKKKKLEDKDENLLGASMCERISLASSMLFYSPIHQLVEKTGMKDGKPYMYHEFLPDDFIEEDSSLGMALYRTRDPHILDYSLQEIYEDKNISADRQSMIEQGIKDILTIWESIDELNSKIIDEDILVSKYVEDKYKEITNIIKKEDYPHWYLTDIDEFLHRFNLSADDYEILYNYILILQCRNRYNYLQELDRLEDREFVLNENYSVKSIIDYTEKWNDFIDYETSLKAGTITQKEYDIVMEYFDNINSQEKINSILDINRHAREKAYIEMMPLIDSLDVSQLTKIKEEMVVTNETTDKFDKFVDYLYLYFYQDLPPWMKLELAKCPHLEEKHTNTAKRKLVPESTFHLDENVKIERSIFAGKICYNIERI